MAVQDGDTCAARLEGFVCKTEDWHCRVTLLVAIFKILFNEEGDGDIGTLKQLKVATCRRFASDVHKDVAAASAFLDLVTDGYITAAAMDYLGMSSVTDTPELFQNSSTVHVLSQKNETVCTSWQKQ